MDLPLWLNRLSTAKTHLAEEIIRGGSPTHLLLTKPCVLVCAALTQRGKKNVLCLHTKNPSICQAAPPRPCVHLEGYFALISTRSLSRPVMSAPRTKLIGLESLTLNNGCHSRLPWTQDRMLTTEVNLKLFLFFTSLTQGLWMAEANVQASFSL